MDPGMAWTGVSGKTGATDGSQGSSPGQSGPPSQDASAGSSSAPRTRQRLYKAPPPLEEIQ
ncbi:hypothetical protein VUR80DRAFT_10217 [Thermomyces stellatus]